MASIHDIHLRKVPNLIWLPACVTIVIVNYAQLLTQYNALPLNWFMGFVIYTVVGIIAAVILAWIMWTKEKTGGADSKGILITGLMYASNPLFILVTFGLSYLSSSVVGIKYKKIPWIPCLTLGYLCTALLLGGVI